KIDAAGTRIGHLGSRRLRVGRRPAVGGRLRAGDGRERNQGKERTTDHRAGTTSDSGILPSADSSTASGRVVSNCARTISATTVLGTHRNMPTTPQMVPHTTSETITTRGERLSERPMIVGSTTFAGKIRRLPNTH